MVSSTQLKKKLTVAIRALPRNILAYLAKISTLHCFFAHALINPVRTSLLLGLQYVIGCSVLGQGQEGGKRVPSDTDGSCCPDGTVFPGLPRAGNATHAGATRSAQGGLSADSRHFTRGAFCSTLLQDRLLGWRSDRICSSRSWCLCIRISEFHAKHSPLPLSQKHISMGTPCWYDTMETWLACQTINVTYDWLERILILSKPKYLWLIPRLTAFCVNKYTNTCTSSVPLALSALSIPSVVQDCCLGKEFHRKFQKTFFPFASLLRVQLIRTLCVSCVLFLETSAS